MNKVLIYSRNYRIFEKLETISKKLGLAVKTVMDIDMAKNFILNREYNLIVVSREISIKEQGILGDTLWGITPSAPIILYIEEEDRKQLAERRLLGIEIVGPNNAEEAFTNFLKNFLPRNLKEESTPLKILYVEDLDSPREILTMYLEKINKGGITALESAKSAIEELKNNPKKYNCIFTDIKMPEMNGHELIKFLRTSKEFSKIPIIVLTAYGTMDWLVNCIEAGASGFLVKPPNKENLKFEINRAIRINQHNLNPRLVASADVETVRELLEAKMGSR